MSLQTELTTVPIKYTNVPSFCECLGTFSRLSSFFFLLSIVLFLPFLSYLNLRKIKAYAMENEEKEFFITYCYRNPPNASVCRKSTSMLQPFAEC